MRAALEAHGNLAAVAQAADLRAADYRQAGRVAHFTAVAGDGRAPLAVELNLPGRHWIEKKDINPARLKGIFIKT